MPTRNGQEFVGQALESIAQEAGASGAVQVIVLDDESTDDTLPIVESYAARLPLTVTDGAKIGNWVASTNRGLALADSSHACFLHQDDLWRPGRLTRMKELCLRHPEAAMWVSTARFVSTDGRDVGAWTNPLCLPGARGGSVAPPASIVSRLLVQNTLSIAAPVFRVDSARELGGMDESLWYTADWDLWLRLAEQGNTVATSEPTVGFRVHPHSQTVTRSSESDAFRAQLEQTFERHWDWLRARGEGTRLVERAARFSIETNVLLAALTHGQRGRWGAWLSQAAGLGVEGWSTYLRHSSILDRVGARVRAGIVRHHRDV